MSKRYKIIIPFIILLLIMILSILFYHTGSSPGCVYWSPDQTKIVYFWWDHKDLWLLVPDGGYFLQQQVFLRWCSVDQLRQQQSLKVDSINFTRSILPSCMPLLFSPDSTKIAIKGKNRISIIELSSANLREISSDKWPIDGWLVPGPPIIDDIPGLTIYNLDGYEVPLGYGSGAVSPDGKRTALVNYKQQVVILDENLKKEK